MLKEEKTRNLEMQKTYLQEIDFLPKGTVTINNFYRFSPHNFVY